MNKSLLAAVLILSCAPLAPAKEASGVKSPAPSAAATSPAKTKKMSATEAATIEKFVALQDAAISTFLELGDTLRSVTDKESADAAAPTIKMAGEQLCTIITAVEALGEPSEAAQQAIMARIANVAEKNEIMEQVMVPMLTLMMQAPPCYGSEALQTELTNLLANLQGAAGIEEEEGDEEDNAPATLREPDADESN